MHDLLYRDGADLNNYVGSEFSFTSSLARSLENITDSVLSGDCESIDLNNQHRTVHFAGVWTLWWVTSYIGKNTFWCFDVHGYHNSISHVTEHSSTVLLPPWISLVIMGLCYGSGDQSPASHYIIWVWFQASPCGTKWHWDRFVSKYFGSLVLLSFH